MKILFLSNGHGEDQIASQLIKELFKLDKNIEISAFPLVGSGDAFKNLPVQILGTRKIMPSAGFIYQSFSNIIKDVFSGFIRNTFLQIKYLSSLRGKFDRAVAIGDIVPIAAAVISKAPFYFIGCAKSDYYDYSYNYLEKYLLKKYCRLSFPRDKKTADNLEKIGIRVKFAGNPMMDCMAITGYDFGIQSDARVIGILPGSHDDLYINMEDILDVAKKINNLSEKQKIKIEFLAALPANADISRIKILHNMRIIRNKFGDVLNKSEIVIGLSGTGNEQAVGFGKPVLSFAGRGVQYTKKFQEKQKELLGDALLASSKENAAHDAMNLLLNEDQIKFMAKTGAGRMGPSGASKKIASMVRNENWI